MIIQQKRNNTIHENLVDAKKYLNDYVTKNKATIKDGEILFTRYYGGGEKVRKLRSYTLRGIVNATNPSQPYVEFDDVNNDNIVRENLLYYSYGIVGSDGCLKPFNYFEALIHSGSQIRSDRTFTFSFELSPRYYSVTPNNNKVRFCVKNKTQDKEIPIKLVNKGYSYLTQDGNTAILLTLNESECKPKERLSVTFQIDYLKFYASTDETLSFMMYIENGGSKIQYMRNPKLELGSEMTDYCENEEMRQKHLYDRSIKYTDNVATSIKRRIDALEKPKYDNNNIEVSFMLTRLDGSYANVADSLSNLYKYSINVAEYNNVIYKNNIVNIGDVSVPIGNQTHIYYVVPALKVKGYNEEKLYLNGYGVDVLYYKGSNTISNIKHSSSNQCVLTKYNESNGYSYYRILNDSFGTSGRDRVLTCIPVNILFNTNGSIRSFMVDSAGKMMYPKREVNDIYAPAKLSFIKEA